VAELVATPDVDIAFSGCRVVSCRRDGDAVAVGAEVEQFDHAYEAGRLLIGNYLTLHSVLLRRNVARAIAFDPGLEAYEDWISLRMPSNVVSVLRVSTAGLRIPLVSGTGG